MHKILMTSDSEIKPDKQTDCLIPRLALIPAGMWQNSCPVRGRSDGSVASCKKTSACFWFWIGRVPEASGSISDLLSDGSEKPAHHSLKCQRLWTQTQNVSAPHQQWWLNSSTRGCNRCFKENPQIGDDDRRKDEIKGVFAEIKSGYEKNPLLCHHQWVVSWP